MMLYASRTGTRRNLAALRAHGWRLLVSPTGHHQAEGMPYALDNGAWTAHQQGRPFDADLFRRAVDKLGARADWIVVPDVVGDAARTLEAFDAWWPELRGAGLLLLAVQDGMTEPDVQVRLRPGVGLFLGGSTAWKERAAKGWGVFARERSLYLHMGRVNSARRVAIAAEAGCHSVDGTSATRFAVNIPKLTNAGSQTAMLWSEVS